MDEQTREIYETQAERWTSRRSPTQHAAAEALAGRTGAGPSVDLGCGPGWYSDSLRHPVVALDLARSMLDEVASRSPAACRVQADLEALPLRRGSVGAALAINSYVHIPRTRVPAALADLHSALRVDAPVTVSLFGGGDEGRTLFKDDDFPGRLFSRWGRDELVDLLTGAGFTVDDLGERTNTSGERSFLVQSTRARTLPDFVGPSMRLLVCGLNPSIYSADVGVGYARPGNRFWPAALAAGIVSRDRDPWHALRVHGVGITDLVKRATVAAAELSTDEFRAGFERVSRLCEWLQPGAVAFVGLAGWRAAVDRKAVPGWQPVGVGGAPAYVLPSTSGLNARTLVSELAEHLRSAANFGSQQGP